MLKKTLAISFHTTQNKKPALPHVLFEGRGIPYNTDTKFLGVNKWKREMDQSH
jgi:hypothetical protein